MPEKQKQCRRDLSFRFTGFWGLSCGVFVGLLLVVGGFVCVPEAWAADTWTQPHKGIRRLYRRTSNQNINVLLVDLCAAGVSLRATASSQRRRTPSSFGKLVGAQAAINGDFFSFSNYSTNGMAMHNGALWSGTKDHSYVAPLAIGAKRIELPHHNNINQAQSWMKEIVSGHPTLLDDGKIIGNPGDPLCTNRHPRTAVGITKDHRTLLMAVVDGRASTRIGMTCNELAKLLLEFGGWDAVNLDGGGSSAMWVANVGVVSRPSDGSERVVANHLAVYARGSGAAAHCPCKAACQGAKIIGNDCGVGDCSKFGATCVDDALGVRCASVFCPPRGTKKVCVDEKLLGTCKDGAITTGDCSKFAAYCSTAGASEARCVSIFCVSDPKQAPVPHGICLPDGRVARCSAAGGVYDAKDCPAGTTCTQTSATTTACLSPDELPREGQTPEPTTPDADNTDDTPASDVSAEPQTPESQEPTSSQESTSSQEPTPDPSLDAGTTAPDADLSEQGGVPEVVVLVPEVVDLTPKDGFAARGCGCATQTSTKGKRTALLGLLMLLVLWVAARAPRRTGNHDQRRRR